MNGQQVPWGGVLFTCSVYLAGVVLNFFVPSGAFDIATSVASLGVLSTWVIFIVCQLRLRSAAQRGELVRPSFRMPGSPYTNWLALGILALVVVLMPFAGFDQAIACAAIPVLVVTFVVGWRLIRRRQAAAAREFVPPPRGGQS
jgi:L-asparagine permease